MKVHKVTVVQRRSDFTTRRGRSDYYGVTRVYFFPQGEKLIDNLMNRRTRPFNDYKKLMREVLDKAVFEHESVVARWSQKAGCSCGCSPGFLLRDRLTQDSVPVDIFVDVVDDNYVEGEAPVIADPNEDVETTG